jgi:hypothetical protein
VFFVSSSSLSSFFSSSFLLPNLLALPLSSSFVPLIFPPPSPSFSFFSSSSFLLPPSSFLLPPSSFLLPASSFLLPPSCFHPFSSPFQVFHDESSQEGMSLYYLGWCHGPSGTSRLFYSLFSSTQDRQWLDIIEDSAWSVIGSDVPLRPDVPGFWNNLGQCCGNAGIVEFFLHLYRTTGKDQYPKFFFLFLLILRFPLI